MPDADDPSLAAATTAHLVAAEQQIAIVRWTGLVLWALVLVYRDYALSPPHAAWLVYAGGLIYALALQWQLARGFPVRGRAWVATVGDPLLAAIMCSVTGGLDSVFLPFCHFTLLAAAFRFGVQAALLVLALNSTLLVAMGIAGSASAADTLLVVAYLCFSAVFGVMLAGWARNNLELASRRAQALHAAHGRLRELLRRDFRLAEEQRKQLAGELHDRMGGELYTIQQGLDDLARSVSADAGLSGRVARLAATVRACTADVRHLMNDLRPTVLDDFGLWEAVREHIARLADEVSFTITLYIDPALDHWRTPHEALLFRLLQEALLNARKYAAAAQVRVACRRTDDTVVLEVSDDGRGFVPARVASGHYGLLTMRERAEALGGRCEVTSAPGEGTTIRVILPVDATV